MNYSTKSKVTAFLTICAFMMGPTLSARAESSDQTNSYKAAAKVSHNTMVGETVKAVLYTTTTAYLTFAAFFTTGVPPVFPLRPSCPIVSMAATGAGLATDLGVSLANKDATQFLTGTISALGSTMAQNAIKNMIDGTVKGATGEVGKKAVTKGECILAASMTAVQAATSFMGRSAAKQGEEQANASIQDLNTRNTAGFVVGSNTKGGSEAGKASAAQAAVASDSCEAQSGNNYLKCVGQTVPEVAAITNSPDAMNALEGALGGKSLGDFVKGFNGNTQGELSNYVANGMGLGSEGASALSKAMDSGEKYAKDNGILDKYTPGGYKSAGNQVASTGSQDLDFNKMMEGMLKQLNPDAADKKGEDPSLIVFRQLDLLPADKIEANKDISLFARIGYRYRKNSSNLEQLNWSRPENQSTAAAPTTDTRAPASVVH